MHQEKLTGYVNSIETELERYTDAEGEWSGLVRAMRYSLEGGKKIRGVLALAFCELCGGELEKALPLACALEMVHGYSLIHDDLPCMDNADLRRGKPSCHAKFGEANALLAGDALLTLAFGAIADSSLPDAAKSRAVSVLSAAAGYKGMAGGQFMDLKYEGTRIGAGTLVQLHSLKTGALIRASAVLGGMAAGAGGKTLAAIDRYAEKLGLCFQIVDDILDRTADAEELGKPAGNDEKNAKNTFVSFYGLEKAEEMAAGLSREAKEILNALDGNAGFLLWLTDLLLERRK
ncbi:MAG: polyprenyl synthetase family protein [Oscillospiraceae bacterium]|nr:polyprenyl synthetase family protein [Oscillospiraceae bacterium]